MCRRELYKDTWNDKPMNTQTQNNIFVDHTKFCLVWSLNPQLSGILVRLSSKKRLGDPLNHYANRAVFDLALNLCAKIYLLSIYVYMLQRRT